MTAIFAAILAYATGTGQILLIEWWRRRQTHRRQITALRWEMRRVLAYDKRFDWPDDLTIPDRPNPRSPRTSELYLKILGEIDLALTDEIEDDNSYLSLTNITDNCLGLQEALDEIEKFPPPPAAENPAQQMERFLTLRGLTKQYDRRLEILRTTATDAIRDLDRRLDETRFRPQVRRTLQRKLPPGHNPPLLKSDE